MSSCSPCNGGGCSPCNTSCNPCGAQKENACASAKGAGIKAYIKAKDGSIKPYESKTNCAPGKCCGDDCNDKVSLSNNCEDGKCSPETIAAEPNEKIPGNKSGISLVDEDEGAKAPKQEVKSSLVDEILKMLNGMFKRKSQIEDTEGSFEAFEKNPSAIIEQE